MSVSNIITGIAGMLIPIISIGAILIAIAYYDNFDWKRNVLSNLGQREKSAQIFNNGLIIAGILAFVFAMGLFRKILQLVGPMGTSFLRKMRSTIGSMGALSLVLAAIALTGIGLFPAVTDAYFPSVPNIDIHPVMAIIFFISLLLALSLIGTYFLLSHRRRLGIGTVLAAIIGTVILLSTPLSATSQFVASMLGSVWASVIGFMLLKRYL